MDDTFWQTKLHARLHDPAEKALVLLRDPAGHEGGTSRALHEVLFKNSIPDDVRHCVKTGDWWASAADRPQWPNASWAQLRWTKAPILIHPLTGKEFDLQTLAETDIRNIKQRSFEHLSRLAVKDGDSVDWRPTLLAFWRFGPELSEDEDKGKLGLLWPLLPADTRVPDHSIWDHLDLTSAFAGAFARGEPALLSLSLGPVQGFIAAARTTSDLWAGSHLLARLSWEAMKVVCERLGPDAILFPRLRGLPQVDVWLRHEMKLDPNWFRGCCWTKGGTDANPLFTAALPNRFVALVPKAEVADLVERIRADVRDWLQRLGQRVVQRLLEAAELPDDGTAHCHQQMREQLAGFPEVHWAAVPFSLIRARNKEQGTDLDTTLLSEAMAPFFDAPDAPGFLGEPAWQVLQKDAQLENGIKFFAPNPGVLYPAVQDLAERALAAAKTTRPFEQREQNGWRCSLTGDAEWLTTDPKQLLISYRQQEDTLWAKVAKAKPAWAKQGEHLGALAAVKRLWPTLFAKEVDGVVGSEMDRFVVSTHTMALASNLERLDCALKDQANHGKLAQFMQDRDRAPALPPALAKLRNSSTVAARVPATLDRLRELDEGTKELARFEFDLKDILGHKPEAYYALLLFDGDHMGRILSGDPEHAITYGESFHPKIRREFAQIAKGNAAIEDYGKQKRAMSPNRHLAISTALNDFALHIVPHVIERMHCGRVIYAGGDDVLAMLPVVDLLPAMQRLRQAYSGAASQGSDTDWRGLGQARHQLVCKDGFAHLNGRLMRMMGGAAGSCGAVIAHHQTPLSIVLKELRAAEQRAKNEGGRDAFSLSVLKRSGGDLRFTSKWNGAIGLLAELRRFLVQPGVSRRAVYHTAVWLKDLPEDAGCGVLAPLIRHQLIRHSANADASAVADLARRLTEIASGKGKKAKTWLTDFLNVAEFLARESRLSLDEQTMRPAQAAEEA